MSRTPFCAVLGLTVCAAGLLPAAGGGQGRGGAADKKGAPSTTSSWQERRSAAALWVSGRVVKVAAEDEDHGAIVLEGPRSLSSRESSSSAKSGSSSSSASSRSSSSRSSESWRSSSKSSSSEKSSGGKGKAYYTFRVDEHTRILSSTGRRLKDGLRNQRLTNAEVKVEYREARTDTGGGKVKDAGRARGIAGDEGTGTGRDGRAHRYQATTVQLTQPGKRSAGSDK